jgi:ferredoxin
MECGACAMNCPDGAIRVDAGVGCASGLINEWLQERKLRRPGGDCCS